MNKHDALAIKKLKQILNDIKMLTFDSSWRQNEVKQFLHLHSTNNKASRLR